MHPICRHRVRHLRRAAALAALAAAGTGHALPSITADNLVAHDARIVYWNVQTKGAMRDGTTTTKEGPRGQVIRPTKVQDGSVCHNYGSACYCTPAKFRITPSLESRWHVLVDSKDRREVACKAGVKPTGHADSKALTREESHARREALRAERMARQLVSRP
jgi:hypothetical protein